MIPDLVCLSHLRWGFVYQRPNHLMSLAAADRRVFFVEEPTFHAGAPRLELEEAAPNLVVATPRLSLGLDGASVISEQRRLLDELLVANEISAPVLWFYTPMALRFSRHLRATTVVYDCMDELSAFAGAPPELAELEAELF